MIDGETDDLTVVLACIRIVIVTVVACLTGVQSPIAAESDQFAGLVAVFPPIACFYILMNEAIATLGDTAVGKARIVVALVPVIAGFEAFISQL